MRARRQGRLRGGATAVTLLSALVLALVAALPAGAAAPPTPQDDPDRVDLHWLHPKANRAVGDLPGSSAGCHAAPAATVPVVCTYAGQGPDPRVVVVLGDSIVAQWWGAIRGAARTAGWEVVWMTKTSCPAAAVSRVSLQLVRYRACDTWRRAALKRIRALPRVDLVVMSGSATSIIEDRSRRAPLTAGSDAWAREWRRGYERTIRGLGERVARIALLRDTPSFRFAPSVCLAAQGGWVDGCTASTSVTLQRAAWKAERSVAADDPRIRAVDMSGWLCTPGRCGPVTDDRVLRYRDNHHMTNTFSATLAPALLGRLGPLVPAPVALSPVPAAGPADAVPRSPRVAEWQTLSA